MFETYKYSAFDYGWGCGWRTIQNMISKLFDVSTTIQGIMDVLSSKGYSFDEQHYGYLDGKMAVSYFGDYPVNMTQYEINDMAKFDNFVSIIENVDYNKSCIMMIHDGYIVMINNYKNGDIEVIDPHQHYDISEFIELKKVGKGGIGWANLKDTIFINKKELLITDENDFLQVNPPSFLIVEKK